MSRVSIPKFLFFIAVSCTSQAFAHSWGPAARATGAPGDDSKACTSCHTGTLNSGSGSVKIILQSGAVYIPGVRQRVTVQVSDPAKQRWGFEMAARLNSKPETAQAGEFTPVDSQTQVICEDNGPRPCTTGVTFIQHTTAGTRNGTQGGVSFQFDWTPPATNAGPVTLYVAGNAANGDNNLTNDNIYTSSVQLNPVTPVAPVVPTGGVMSAATLVPGSVPPNSWVTVYGSNLGATTRSWNETDFANGALPMSLDGVSVVLTVFGAPRLAYVGYVSPTQVNFLLPVDALQGNIQVQVRNSAGISAPIQIGTTANSPQLLTLDGKYALGVHADGSLLGKTGLVAGAASAPAQPGETLTFYCTGCGATTPATISGLVPTKSSVNTLPVVTVGGAAATVTSASTITGSPGLYQVNVQVPAATANGDQPVVIRLGTTNSVSTLITVQR